MDSHGITVEKLREASQEARRHINPAHRLEVLDEIYYVRSMEEKYLRGEIGKIHHNLSILRQLTESRWKQADPSRKGPPTKGGTINRETANRTLCSTFKNPRICQRAPAW